MLFLLKINAFLMFYEVLPGKKNVFKKIQFICCLILTTAALYSCGNSEKVPDVSNIRISIASQRLDYDLAGLDTNNLQPGLQALKAKYPDFLDFYLDTLMGFGIRGNYADTSKPVAMGLRLFLTHKDYRGLFDTVLKHYPDTKEIDKELTDGFTFMKYYYPNYKLPKIIYLVSGLNNWGAFTYESSIIGIGLDMFLGGSYPFYRSVGLPDYMDKHLTPAYIPVAVFRSVYEDMHPFVMENKTLLDMIVQRGKEQYFLQRVLPKTADTTLLGYSKFQLDWCQKNESEVYNYFIQKNLFYERDWQKILRYVNDGPTSTGMPAESPGNIGTWVGLQIVNAYMEQHPEATMQQMLAQPLDAQRFLEESKYKPK